MGPARAETLPVSAGGTEEALQERGSCFLQPAAGPPTSRPHSGQRDGSLLLVTSLFENKIKKICRVIVMRFDIIYNHDIYIIYI